MAVAVDIACRFAVGIQRIVVIHDNVFELEHFHVGSFPGQYARVAHSLCFTIAPATLARLNDLPIVIYPPDRGTQA
jgi:hypothetical protein